ncbi:MAG: antiterminator LoaP [Lachnospiraceae bacterium]|nr:antiterminator LoaP [Lachnospiraceae bacterium]
MWYVMQTQTGKEAEMAQKCMSMIAKNGENVFVMYGERMFKYLGNWEKRMQALFRGYVFIDTDDIEDFRIRTFSLPNSVKILKSGDEMWPIHADEEDFLKMIGGEDHIVRMSEGYAFGDKLSVTSGSMVGMEGRVRSIDRHNRTATLFVRVAGRELEVKVGLEIVAKVAEE